MSTLQVRNQHLLWRAGFGVSVADVPKLTSASSKEMFTAILKPSLKKPAYLDVGKDLIEELLMSDMAQVDKTRKEMTEEERKDRQREIRKQNREGLKNLNLSWLNEMSTTDAPLREKMALFWHGHFACRHVNSYYQQMLLDQVRTHALGSFRELLTAVSKSASMLAFLNNQQNRKQHPNENFAREVMELFTLGRGNYTERDVKEAARAFTGWGYNFKGEFVFRKFAHDDGSKNILGKTGNFSGEDVLNILLEQKQTAQFIARKVYRYFVNEVADESKVSWLANRFCQSDYSIQSLMSDIFTSDWFYDEKNLAARIKSPVELLVGMRRILPMKLQEEDVQLLMQRALGQILFYPPNVAGWPGGKSWIDSSTLMFRLRIPLLIKDNEDINITPKTDDDQAMGMMEGEAGFTKNNFKKQPNNRLRINADVDWETYIRQFEKVSKDKLYETIEGLVLQTHAGSVSRVSVEKMMDNSSRENYIKSLTIALMSTPEYQLS